MTEPDTSDALTDELFWPAYWQNLKLPVAADEAKARPYEREILKVLKRFGPKHAGSRIVEIGGAPGGYLAYFARASDDPQTCRAGQAGRRDHGRSAELPWDQQARPETDTPGDVQPQPDDYG